MYIQRTDNIYEELDHFKVIHGHAGIAYLNSMNFNKVPNVSKDVKVVMITNLPYRNPINKLYKENPEKIDFEYIVLNKPDFRCGEDLIYPLYDYIKTIKNKYVLYLDASDTAIMSDIDDPQTILDTYKCKMLFNAEDGYSFPDHPCVDKSYIMKFNEKNIGLDYYGKAKDDCNNKNISSLRDKMKGCPYTKSLNSGLFLGETEYTLFALSKMISLMKDDPTKGYPYGELENQKSWQFLQTECQNNEIEIDYLNLFFLWNHSRKFDFPPDHWEHFNFFNKLYK